MVAQIFFYFPDLLVPQQQIAGVWLTWEQTVLVRSE
jgi:hypothetical protein